MNFLIGLWSWLTEAKKETQIKRLEECDMCAPDKSICPECGCFKELKVRVRREKCPKGIWQ